MGGVVCFFFVKRKTAYEMRISDWSSDVCSSDLLAYPRSDPGMLAAMSVDLEVHATHAAHAAGHGRSSGLVFNQFNHGGFGRQQQAGHRGGVLQGGDRKGGVSGKSVSVRVDLVGRRNLKKTNRKNNNKDNT